MAERRRFRWGFVVAAIVLVALVAWLIISHQKKAPPSRPPVVAVATATASRRDVTLSVSALGQALAWQGVTLTPQVTGVLIRAPVAEGADVRKGQLLGEINPAPYQAAVLQAQGALQRDQASLREAQLDLARYRKLAAQDSIARQQVDTQAALVAQDEGTVTVDQGALKAAQVNLGFTRIVSPVNGRLGVRLVDPGNLVSSGTTSGIFVVNQIQPIAVTFSVPQGDFQRLVQVSDGFRMPLAVQALSQETGQVLDTGELRIVDNHVDTATGTVELKGRFDNARRLLWPGQFVNVRLSLQTLRGGVVIPVTAVNQGPKGPFAYVVDANHKAQVRPLTVTATQDDVAVIEKGVAVGDTVVTDGQLTLKPGATVAMRPASQTR